MRTAELPVHLPLDGAVGMPAYDGGWSCLRLWCLDLTGEKLRYRAGTDQPPCHDHPVLIHAAVKVDICGPVQHDLRQVAQVLGNVGGGFVDVGGHDLQSSNLAFAIMAFTSTAGGHFK